MNVIQIIFRFFIIQMVLSVYLFTGNLNAQETTENEVHESPFFTDHLGENLIHSFFGWQSIFHLTAISGTWILVDTNADADTNDYVQSLDKTGTTIFGTPGLAAGAVLPVALPLGMYFFSDDEDTVRAGCAAFQAVAIAFLSNSMLKAITGRSPPDDESEESTRELSRDFNFGFFRKGIFYGWPSGHSMVNMSLAAALVSYYPEKMWLKPVAFGYALYVMASVVFGNGGNVHWLSEAFAGGLMGFAIGWTVGSRFHRDRFPVRSEETERSSSAGEVDFYISRDVHGYKAMASFYF